MSPSRQQAVWQGRLNYRHNWSSSIKLHVAGAGVAPKHHPALLSPGWSLWWGASRLWLSKAGKKKGGGGMTSRHLWRLKLKQTGKKKKKSSSSGKVVITVQSAIHLTKSHTGTVLMGGSRLMEGCRLKRGSSDVVDIFIWAMLSPFNYFRQDDWEKKNKKKGMGLLGMSVPGGKGRCAGGFLLRHRWVLGLGTVVPPCLFTVIPFIPSKTLSSFPQRCCSSSCPWWAQSRQDSVLAITPSHNLQAQMKYNEARCLACRDSWCHTQMLWVSYTLQILGEKKKE